MLRVITHWLHHSVRKPWSSIAKSIPSLFETWSLRVCSPWADEETLDRTVAQKRRCGTSVNAREEQLKLKEKTPMITQPLLDAPRVAMTKDSMGPNRLLAERAVPAEITPWSILQIAMSRVQKQNGKPFASHLRRWLRRWLHLRNLLLDSSWHRSNCLLADGLVRQWMLLCRKKRTRYPCETVRSMRVFWLARAALARILSF